MKDNLRKLEATENCTGCGSETKKETGRKRGKMKKKKKRRKGTQDKNSPRRSLLCCRYRKLSCLFLQYSSQTQGTPYLRVYISKEPWIINK